MNKLFRLLFLLLSLCLCLLLLVRLLLLLATAEEVVHLTAEEACERGKQGWIIIQRYCI